MLVGPTQPMASLLQPVISPSRTSRSSTLAGAEALCRLAERSMAASACLSSGTAKGKSQACSRPPIQTVSSGGRGFRG